MVIKKIGITQASATRIILAGGAQAKNIFRQSAGVVALGTNRALRRNSAGCDRDHTE